MLDLKHLPDGANQIQRFYAAGSLDWKTWTKPRGCRFVEIICIGAGGGGGGGFTAIAGSARGGGGGGGCGTITRTFIAANLLPDILYVQVGPGGAGAAAGGTGTAGGDSYVSTTAATTPAFGLCRAGGASGGSPGSGAAGGAGGAAPNVATVTSALFLCLGNFVSTVGIIGGAGGAQTGAVGTTITAFASVILSPGAGGGGTPTANTDFAGGGITGAGWISTIAGGAAAAGAGSAGVTIWKPLCSCGGCGGGTAGASGVAGAGGNGGLGSGGGGGGGGVTGGAGGKGGDGFVLIVAY